MCLNIDLRDCYITPSIKNTMFREEPGVPKYFDFPRGLPKNKTFTIIRPCCVLEAHAVEN
jgi:hypothetical protein